MSAICDVNNTSIVYRQGVRPELFTVASGSYLSNISFGSGAIPQVTYNGVEIPHGINVTYTHSNVVATFDSETFSTYRRCDDKVFFNINIDINTKNNPPSALAGMVATGSELRIRNLIPYTSVIGGIGSTNIPSSFTRSWPPPRTNSMSPLFRDVQIYTLTDNTSNAYWVPASFNDTVPINGVSTGTYYDLGARLLTDDTIALYINIFNVVPTLLSLESPITYEAFNAAVGFSTSNPTGSTARLVLRGEYFTS